MLFYYCVIISLTSAINSQDLTNKTDINATSATTTVTPATLTSTENDLSLQTTSSSAATKGYKENDFYSLTLETFPTSSTSLEEITSSTTATVLNDLKDILVETTPSWELIYPERNSTNPDSSSTFSNTFSTVTTAPLTAAFQTATLPKYFKVDDVTNCQRFFGHCLRQVLGKVMPKLKDGNKPAKPPSLDPIYFNATAFQYNSGPFTGFITIRYALIYGLTAMKFNNVDFNYQADKFKARLNISFPRMKIIGSYKGDMHINNVRVRPRGDFNVSIMGLGVDLLSLGVIYKKDNHTFLRFTKSNATTTLKDSKINATGVFPDQRLNDIVVNVANQYWRDLFNIVLPETRNNWLPILLSALNAALDMVPFDFFNVKN